MSAHNHVNHADGQSNITGAMTLTHPRGRSSYESPDGWLADVIPFYWRGDYHLFYLKDYRNVEAQKLAKVARPASIGCCSPPGSNLAHRAAGGARPCARPPI